MRLQLAFLAAGMALAQVCAADDQVTEDSLHLGGTVEITQTVEGPLKAAAGKIVVDAPVHGSVKLGGGNIQFTPAALISGDVSLGGGTVNVEGAINGNLHAAAGTITLDGAIGGDATVVAGTLNLGPNARIAGKLSFRGGHLEQDPAAQVTGGVVQEGRHRMNWHTRSTGERFLRGWLWTAGLVVLAALLAAALPGPSARMASELRDRPWLTPLLGLVALSTIPVAAVLLMITVIGIPIALLGLVGYAALLLLGYVWLAVAVGGLLLDRIKPEVAAQAAYRAGAAVLAMLGLAVLARTPFIGGLVVFTAILVGVGMIVGALFRRREPAAPATVVG